MFETVDQNSITMHEKRRNILLQRNKSTRLVAQKNQQHYYYYCYHGSIAVLLSLGRFFTSLHLIQSRWDSFDRRLALRKATTYAQDNTEWTNTDIHASSKIRTHEPSVWAAFHIFISLHIFTFHILRQRGHCDRINRSMRTKVWRGERTERKIYN